MSSVIPDHHVWFHNLFGRITTIRTALWELSQHPLPKESQDMHVIATRELDLLIKELEAVRDKVYTRLDTQ